MTFTSRLDRRRRFGGGVLVGLAVWLGLVGLVGPTTIDLAAQPQPTPLTYTVDQASQGQFRLPRALCELSR